MFTRSTSLFILRNAPVSTLRSPVLTSCGLALLILPKMCSRYASQGMAGLVPVWRAYGFGWFLASCGFAGVVSIVGKPVMHLLYAGRFDDVAPLMAALAFLPAIMSLGNTLNGALKAIEKPNLVFYSYICSGVATLLFGIPLVTYFGLRGAVYGMLVTAAVYTTALGAAFAQVRLANPLAPPTQRR